MTVSTRKLGDQGLEVPAIGLGCMGISQSYGPTDEAESIATCIMRSGCTFLDTAQVYGPFTNEDLLGRTLAGKRHQVVIATKFGFNIENGKNIGGTAVRRTSDRPSRDRSDASGPITSIFSISIASIATYRSRMWPAPSPIS